MKKEHKNEDERVEAEHKEAERVEAEHKEAMSVEAEHKKEAESVEADHKNEAERVEAECEKEAERVEAERKTEEEQKKVYLELCKENPVDKKQRKMDRELYLAISKTDTEGKDKGWLVSQKVWNIIWKKTI